MCQIVANIVTVVVIQHFKAASNSLNECFLIIEHNAYQILGISTVPKCIIIHGLTYPFALLEVRPRALTVVSWSSSPVTRYIMDGERRQLVENMSLDIFVVKNSD